LYQTGGWEMKSQVWAALKVPAAGGRERARNKGRLTINGGGFSGRKTINLATRKRGTRQMTFRKKTDGVRAEGSVSRSGGREIAYVFGNGKKARRH